MAYDKNIASVTIFDEIGYDEMQKTENHEIGFKLFRVLFFISLLFAFIMTMICEAAENVPGIIVSLVFMAIVYGFYIAYAYMTAKRGIMNPKFAKGWSGKGSHLCQFVGYYAQGSKLVARYRKILLYGTLFKCGAYRVVIIFNVCISHNGSPL